MIPRYLVDTNVLLSASRRINPANPVSTAALDALVFSGAPLHYTLQNAAEFWSVFTRPPERNGLGLTPAAAEQELADLEAMLVLLPETTDVYTHWRRLVADYGIAGIKVHDARLLASMLAHRVSQLLTLNGADFAPL
jgi:predicted nucleic acid-binding protein